MKTKANLKLQDKDWNEEQTVFSYNQDVMAWQEGKALHYKKIVS